MFHSCFISVAKASLIKNCTVLLSVHPYKQVEITTKEKKGSMLQLRVRELNAFTGEVELAVRKIQGSTEELLHRAETSITLLTQQDILLTVMKGYYENLYREALSEIQTNYEYRDIEVMLNTFYYYCYIENKSLTSYLLTEPDNVRLLIKHDAMCSRSGVYTYTFIYYTEEQPHLAPYKQAYVKGIYYNTDGSQTNKSYPVRTQEEIYGVLKSLLESARKK